jgi:hypothetical protein
MPRRTSLPAMACRLVPEADHLHLSVNLVGLSGVQPKRRDMLFGVLRQSKLTQTLPLALNAVAAVA